MKKIKYSWTDQGCIHGMDLRNWVTLKFLSYLEFFQ